MINIPLEYKTNTHLSTESTSVPEMKLFCDTPKKLLTIFQLTWESAGIVERIKNYWLKVNGYKLRVIYALEVIETLVVFTSS